MFQRTLLRFTALFLLATAPLQALAAPKATLAAPAAEGPTQVEYSTAAVSKWTDLPIGTYRVPNSDVIISGHQKGGAAGVLFGVVGITIQHMANAHSGKEAMASAEQALTFSIDDEAKAKLQAALADPAYASVYTSDANAARKLEVTGAVVLSHASQSEVLPYVTLRVKLLGKGGKDKLWTTRYIASSGARRSLVGEGSWTADGGTLLRAQVSRLIDVAITTMLKDIATPYPRDEAALVNVHGFFPHVNKPLQVVGYKLFEEDGRMLFLPKLGTMIVFAGINILDTASVWQQPATKKDAPLKVLKPDDPTLAGILSPAAAAASPAVEEAAGELPAATDDEVEGTQEKAESADGNGGGGK